MAKKSNTGLIVGLSIAAVAVLGAGGAAVYLMGKKGDKEVESRRLEEETKQAQFEQQKTAANTAAAIAQANAEASAAASAAEAAKAQYDAYTKAWYMPIAGGLGTAIGEFNWNGLAGL